jgi:hypothetical protein
MVPPYSNRPISQKFCNDRFLQVFKSLTAFLLNVISHKNIALANVEPVVRYSRLGPVFAGASSNPERTDYFKTLRRRLNQSHIAVFAGTCHANILRVPALRELKFTFGVVFSTSAHQSRAARIWPVRYPTSL